MKNITSFFIMILYCLSADADSKIEARLFEQLKQGELIAIMRHALAPGTGDPDNFTLGQCNTQRNLSTKGREQAKQIGERFRKYGITSADIYSSEWCRCMDTATELALGDVMTLPIINSFFRRNERAIEQTEALKGWLLERYNKRPKILVTHQVNMTSLTGVFPRSGEIVFIRVEPNTNLIIVEGTVL
ncbi:MAG: histidine phosphatase family protein [Cellvibrionaceae bacterium]